MKRGMRPPGPALIVACAALFVALSGTVYAAATIDGATIAVKSLPGNRLKKGSLTGNRLKPGTIQGSRVARQSITGLQVDAATLGKVPSAVHADFADSAHDAETALNAVDAVTANAVNGHTAGCKAGTRPFAGACWQTADNEAAVTAPAAAESCAAQGGELPEALALAAFARQPNIELAEGGEWTSDLTNVSGRNLYAAVIVSEAGVISSAVSSANQEYRCVIPLVS